jgi:hypothetical protein
MIEYVFKKIILIEWCLEIKEDVDIGYGTILNAVNMFDKVYEKIKMEKNMIQTYMFACIMLSSKLFDISVPDIEGYTAHPEMEGEIVTQTEEKILELLESKIIFNMRNYTKEEFDLCLVFLCGNSSYETDFELFLEHLCEDERKEILNIKNIKDSIAEKSRKYQELIFSYDNLQNYKKEQIEIKEQKIEVSVIDFSKIEKIGRGSFGDVYKYGDYALKIYKSPYDNGICYTIVRELSFSAILNHENLLKIRHFKQEGKWISIMNRCDHDLSFGNCIGLNIKSVVRQLLNVLKYLHTNNIMHRDIKPDNILYDKKKEKVYLTDFGISKCIISYPITKEAFSWGYKPIENLYENVYDYNADIWSLGISLIEIVNNKFLFSYTKDRSEALENLYEIFGYPSVEDLDCLGFKNKPKPIFKGMMNSEVNFRKIIKTEDNLLIDLIKNMLVYNPSKRYNIIDCLNHPYLKEVRL